MHPIFHPWEAATVPARREDGEAPQATPGGISRNDPAPGQTEMRGGAAGWRKEFEYLLIPHDKRQPDHCFEPPVTDTGLV